MVVRFNFKIKCTPSDKILSRFMAHLRGIGAVLTERSLADNKVHVCSHSTGWAKKKEPLRIFANISAKSKNFEIMFHRLEGNSYLRIMAKFHRKVSNRTKVISLLVSPPT